MTSVRPRHWLSRLFAKKAKKPRVSPYHSVTIHCEKNACQVAQDSQGVRYLSSEAPLLPLDQCDRPDQCECRYRHYEDRRGGPRRGSATGSTAKSDAKHDERRQLKDRREDDADEADEPFSVHKDSYYEHAEDTIRSATLDVSEPEGVDPYNSGSFDKSNSWKSTSRK